MNPPCLRVKNRGSSLVETAVSVAILVTLGGGVFSLVTDSGAVFTSSLRSSMVRSEAMDALEALNRDVQQANATTLSIDPVTDPSGDIVSLQVPVGIAGGNVSWGAMTSGPQGAPQPGAGFTIQYRLLPDPSGKTFQLVRRVLDTTGLAAAPDLLVARDIDAPTNGGKGFQVQRAGNFVFITLRVRVGGDAANPVPATEDVVRTQTATIRLRAL